MKNRSVIILVFVMTVFALATTAGCNLDSRAAEYKKFNSVEEVQRISVQDAKREVEAGTAVIVDSRGEDAYKAEHISGSINVPIGSPAEKLQTLPQDKKLIIYCSCGSEGSSMKLAFQLNQIGYAQTVALHGGTVAWHNAGFPMERKN